MAIRFAVDAGSDTVALAIETGCKGVPGDVGSLLASGVDKVVEPLREKGLELCELMCFGLNLLHPEAALRQRGVDELCKALPLAKQVGCPYVVTTAGNYNSNIFGLGDPENFTDSALKEAAAGLEEPLRIAEAHGVSICIKPFIKTAVYSAESFLRLKEICGSENLKVSLDVAGVYDVADIWNPVPKTTHVCRALREHIGILHLKEIGMVPGYYVQLELLAHGSGATPWDVVLRECADHVPEDSWVIIEHIESLEDGRAAVPLITRIAQDLGIAYS